VPKDFYSGKHVLLHRAIAAAIGLHLHSLYRGSLRAWMPDRFSRLLRELDNNETKDDSQTSGEEELR
jgi:hypothetical protein